MSFMSNLKKVREMGISVWRLAVANEVDYFFSSKYEEEQLEGICEFVYDWVMNTEASPKEVCEGLDNLLADEEITIEQIMECDEAVTEALNYYF